ncbi:nuclear transport factor 2 family protein [Hymenobacter sp. YC55]|uniref:nuclear transport factor 2 family protein n=1 Tax=Hymenobacter sp. YC55 TaxID=3034019 RepID=UPI0023F7B4C2|nr:nuclear transport factor 2 family protein [Hymenobacter sp. YC55]MDF7815859.1 nuclear transport factor 2 family protein [Hymenobacter sp. YC55]
MQLPATIEGFVQAQNEGDSTGFAHYFTADATVSDEGHTYAGRAAIRDWIQQATDKYHMHTNPVAYQQAGASAILTAEVTGTFPGSPAVLQYHLELDEALISSLRITG